MRSRRPTSATGIFLADIRPPAAGRCVVDLHRYRLDSDLSVPSCVVLRSRRQLERRRDHVPPRRRLAHRATCGARVPTLVWLTYRLDRVATSDVNFRMRRVEQARARSRRETSDIGSADDSLLDPVDCLRGLAHMDVLREWVERASTARGRSLTAEPRTSAERHLRTYGHRLLNGCCAPYATSAREIAA